MRTYQLLKDAVFAKAGEPCVSVTLPHTWNNLDGQDGGGDYWRGVGTYEISLPDPTKGKRQYIELRGANHVATVWCNGQELGTHKGGFSTFRYELTQAMKQTGNTLKVAVSNAVSNIYPQHADFTFFGGIYRDVYFVEVDDAHFDLMKHGTEAVFVSAYSGGITRVDMFPVNAQGCQIRLELLDGEGQTVFDITAEAQAHTFVDTVVKEPHLWQGVDDPYLYSARATLLRGEEVLDQVQVTYGYRSYRVDAQYGFFLNGKSLPLRGVCRHQDRQDKGWAISREDHLEDATMIQELGANTVRLAHYQHDPYFYDLCDQMGFAVWAEIPYISHHLPGQEAYDTTLSMMTELIAQCYNHPSILVWGIANEITIFNTCEEQYRNLCDLQALAKRLDPSRLTTMAQLARLPITSPHVQVTDIQGYNYYYGWYTGTMQDNGPMMDAFHQLHPDRALGISEYGVETILRWHSAQPFNHDYTEEYATLYHHEMLKTFEARPWLWATHVWNMFDFAADARDEGGVRGRNNKGLVTMDRKIKKDTYYVYQAYWTKAPMVHITGRRFRDRAPGERDVRIYTNADSVTLSINGKLYGTLEAKDHMVIFPEVELLPGENTLIARVEGAEDSVVLCGVQAHNTEYDLPDLAAAMQVGNWFSEQEENEDYGDAGYNTELPVGVLLSEPRCFEIVKGWIMAKQSVDISDRFKFVSALPRYRDSENYNHKALPEMATIKKNYTQEDLAVLNKLLRGIKRSKASG